MPKPTWSTESNECWTGFENHLVGLVKVRSKGCDPTLDGIPESRIQEYLKEAELPDTGKSVLYDGCTGELLPENCCRLHVHAETKPFGFQ